MATLEYADVLGAVLLSVLHELGELLVHIVKGAPRQAVVVTTLPQRFKSSLSFPLSVWRLLTFLQLQKVVLIAGDQARD